MLDILGWDAGENGVLMHVDEISMRSYKESASAFAEEIAWRSIPLEAKCTCTYIVRGRYPIRGIRPDVREGSHVFQEKVWFDMRVWIPW